MGAKLKSKKHLLNTFFDFLSRFCAFGFKTIFLNKIKKDIKNAEFHADFKSIEKFLFLNAPKKV
jgi:hypothetical protein